MAISYNGLWKLLIDKGMNKGDLQEAVGISSSTMAKMTKGEAVSMSILLAESLSKSSFAKIRNKELYEALQKNFVSQLKVFKQEDFRKIGEKIRHSMPDIDALSSNLQRAAKAVQTSEYKNTDEIDDEIYDEYSSDIEQILAGELTDEEIVERNEKSEGKLAKLLYRIIAFIVTTFLAGYLQCASGPVYKLINKVIVKEDIDDFDEKAYLYSMSPIPRNGWILFLNAVEDRINLIMRL